MYYYLPTVDYTTQLIHCTHGHGRARPAGDDWPTVLLVNKRIENHPFLGLQVVSNRVNATESGCQLARYLYYPCHRSHMALTSDLGSR